MSLLVDVIHVLPQGALSRGWGWVARRRRPRWLVGLLKRGFVQATHIDLTEAEPVGSYDTLEDLFVRRLRKGARRIDPQPDAVVSPVDGTVGACGTVENGTLLQVKGRPYDLADLLDDADLAKRFEGGSYATLYLAPHNYHRVHAPVAGEVGEATIIPGRLMPVFSAAVGKVPRLFAQNERLITYIDSPDCGRVAVVKVGATLVGRITVAYDPGLQTNLRGQLRRRLRYDPPKLLNKGAEVGAFELGSTVVLLAEPGRVELNLTAGEPVQVGVRVGVVKGRQRARRRRTAGDI